MKKTKKLFVMSLVLMVVMACAATVSAKTFSQSGEKEGSQTTQFPRMEIRELFGQSEPVLRRTQQ